jgi:hypothetical protein
VTAKRPIGLPNPHPGSVALGSPENVRPPSARAELDEEAPGEPVASDEETVDASTDVPNCRNREMNPLVMIGESGHGTNINVPEPPDVPPTPAALRPAEEARGSSRNGG